MRWGALLGDSRGVRYSATLVADPLAKQSLALSPFQGACVIPLREFTLGFEGRTPLAKQSLALSPKGACVIPLREFILRFEGRTPLAILRMALSPKGACVTPLCW